MTDNDAHDSAPRDDGVQPDGGAVASAGDEHRETDYLSNEVNLLKPSTPFMRDHLRVVWTGFTLWFLIVFGPPTLTFLAPDVMSSGMPVLGFPLHYFLIALGGPTGALVLAFWYSRKRDALDEKYGIEHGGKRETSAGGEDVAATDGGVDS
jgi:putative solute:sodium symporter small subunit